MRASSAFHVWMISSTDLPDISEGIFAFEASATGVAAAAGAAWSSEPPSGVAKPVAAGVSDGLRRAVAAAGETGRSGTERGKPTTQ